MGHSHLSDDRLIEVCLDEQALPGEQQHLRTCLDCESRRADLEQMLGDCHAAAVMDADMAFPEERLLRQRMRILQRLEHEGQPGRVLAFPLVHGEPPLTRRRASTRWIAVAAAAGLVIGVVAGEVAHEVRGIGTPMLNASASVSQAAASATSRLVTAPALSDEEFLVLMDRAIQRSGGPALGPLDEMTPRVWEVAAR